MGLFDELDGVPTYTVSELGAELQGLLREAYASVWVVGETHRRRALPQW